jgi:hypothetical protein
LNVQKRAFLGFIGVMPCCQGIRSWLRSEHATSFWVVDSRRETRRTRAGEAEPLAVALDAPGLTPPSTRSRSRHAGRRPSSYVILTNRIEVGSNATVLGRDSMAQFMP